MSMTLAYWLGDGAKPLHTDCFKSKGARSAFEMVCDVLMWWSREMVRGVRATDDFIYTMSVSPPNRSGQQRHKNMKS